MEPGTGKTWVDLIVSAWQFQQGWIDTLFVLAPNGVHLNWPGEVAQHFPDTIPHAVEVYETGMGKAQTKRLEELRNTDGILRIITMNTEAMSTSRKARNGYEFAKLWLNKHNPKVKFTLDESHHFKTPGSSRTMNVTRLGKLTKSRRVMTGTPAPKGWEDVFTQFRFLDPGIIDCETMAEFKAGYCVMAGPYNKIVKYVNIDRLQRRIDPYRFTGTVAELGINEPIVIPRAVLLSNEQRKAYNELRREYQTQFENGQWVQSEVSVTRMIKLHQILSGFVYHEDGTVSELPCPRLDVAMDIIEQAPGKVLLWSCFRYDIVRLTRAMKERGISFVTYTGENKATRWEGYERFKADPSIKVFCSNPGAGGEGLTMNEAHTAVYYSHSWKYVHRAQSIARNNRIGQENLVTVFDLQAPGTMDTRILRGLADKRDIDEQVKNPDVIREILNMVPET